MTDVLGSLIDASPVARRLAWRVGRLLYRDARGEVRRNRPDVNGESYVQRAVIAATAAQRALTVLDIGANQGEWSRLVLEQLPAARRSPERLRMHAFEPVPSTRERLARTLSALSGGGLVQVEGIALSDVAGRAPMAILSDTGGTNTLQFDAALASSALATIEIETETLSQFCARLSLGDLDLVKVDAEGHDFKVIAGGADLLSAGRVAVMQFEYNHRWIYARAYLKDVFDLVAGLPYTVARVRPTCIETFSAWHPELERYFESNYVIVHERALGWFDARKGRIDGSNIYAW